MGIFDKRKSISRQELSSTLKRHHGRIPSTGGKKYYHNQRSRITREVFDSKYGSQIDKNEYQRTIRDLQSTKKDMKTSKERRAVDEKIRYLKDLGGKNI